LWDHDHPHGKVGGNYQNYLDVYWRIILREIFKKWNGDA
jgi:hypothetical protein